jgi:hypothetical protein
VCWCAWRGPQERIQGLEHAIEAARRAAFSSAFTPSWFVLFKSQSAAMMAASTRIYAHDNRRFQVRQASQVVRSQACQHPSLLSPGAAS